METLCECGGALRNTILESVDFTPYAGIPVRLSNVPGIRCSKCKRDTLPGELINFTLNMLAYEITKLPQKLNGQLAKFLRKRLGFTQQVLAEHMLVDRTTVADWERGEKEISPHNDYILRGMLVTAFVKLGLLTSDATFMNHVRREKPLPTSALPDGAIAEINERLRSGGSSMMFSFRS